MAETPEVTVLLFLVLLIFTPEARSNGLQLPSISCPNYFHYEPRGRGYIGKITLSDVPFSKIDVQVTFSQKQPLGQSYKGRISFEQDLTTVQTVSKDKKPISFNVEFPIATEIPKLIHIQLNGENICSTNIPKEHEVIYSFRRSFTPRQSTNRIPNTTSFSINTFADESFLETADSILCGVTEFNTINETDGKYDVRWGWFPWAAKIYTRNKAKFSLSVIANGVLISSRTVVTAIHSLTSDGTTDDIIVQLGAFGLNDIVDSYPVTRHVRTLLTHPQYRMHAYSDADIALLQWDEPVSFSKYILPICLWTEPEEPDRIVGETGYVTFSPSNGLDQVINTTVISQLQCLQSHIVYSTTISERTLCVDYHNITGPHFYNDGGSALIMNRNGRWTLRGVYSACLLFNNKCNTQLHFVYSDVAKFGTWIRHNIII